MTVMRLGLMRDLRKICQDFSRAMALSTGALAWARARLTVRWAGVSSPPGGRPFEAGGDPGARAGVGAVGEDGHALAFADPDDAVGAAQQGGRDPQQLADGIGEDLDVHAVSAVLGGTVRTAVTDAVALGEGSVEEDEVRVVLAQRLHQTRGPAGEQVRDGGDVGVRGADGYAETGRVPREAVVAAQVHQSDECALRQGWREFFSRQWLWVVVAQYAVVVAALNATTGVLGPLVAEERLGGARATFPSALPMMLLAGSTPVWTVVVAMFVAGVASDIFGVLWATTMQREIPEEILSHVSSYDWFGSLAFAPLGLLIAGPIATSVGTSWALAGCAALIVAATAGALFFPEVRNPTNTADTE
jgi:hypothetical protein